MTQHLDALQAIVDANDQAVFALDRDLRYTAFNEAHAAGMRALYGAKIALGGRLLDYQTVEADRDGAAVNLAKALAGARVVADAPSGEAGRRRLYELVHTPLLDAAGEVTGVVVRTYDVTARHLSEQRYGLLFEHMREGFAYCRMYYDDAGRPDDFVYLTVNPAFERLTGLSDVAGRRVTDVIPTIKAETPELFDTYGKVARTGEPAHFEIDFTPLDLSLSISVFRPEPDHFVAVFTDVSERIRVERALRHSESELKALVETVPDIVFQVDREYRLVIANERFAQTSAAAVGRPISPGDLALDPRNPRGFNDEWRSFFDRAFAGESFMVETSPQLPNGARTMENFVSPVQDDHGEPIGVVVTSRDITARKQAELALRESEARHRSLFESMPQGVVYQDAEGRIIAANPSAERILGLSLAQMQGRTSSDPSWRSVHEDGSHFPGEEHPASIALRTGHPVRDVVMGVFNPATETTTWMKVCAVPQFRLGEDAPHQVFATFDDVTERKQATDEIARLNADLERRVRERTRELTAANVELEDFVHSIAHDLRSPLRALGGFSELMQADYREVIDDTGRDYLRRIHEAARHLGDLMDALLSLSGVNRRELVMQDVDLSALARAAVAQLRDDHPGRAVEISIEDGLVTHSDASLCEIVVQNLLDNAWKFSARESPASISFRLDCRDGQSFYCVRDNGVGFDPAYSDKLFKPFERLHATADFKGTGIGLATVQRAVTRLGGRCWAASEPGAGAQVCFTLGEEC